MNTFLGVSPELDHGEVDADLVAGGRIVYLEGYLFDRPEAKAAFRQAAGDRQGQAGRQVALTLSDSFCVDRHRAEFLELIKTEVDILFANESEITALYQTQSFEDAVAAGARSDTKLAVLTRSAKGSVIFSGDKAVDGARRSRSKRWSTPPAPAISMRQASSTALPAGKSLEICGRLGSLAAAEIIGHVGARPETPLAKLAKSRGL